MKSFKTGYFYLILLATLILFHIVSNFFWLKADNSIPKHDENQYLTKSIRCYRILCSPGANRLYRILETEPKIRPHLFPLTAIPFYLLRGVSYDAACLSNSFFLALLILAVFSLGREIGNNIEGLTAAFITSFYPFILIFSRSFWSELPLIAVFAGSLYLMLKTRDFRNRIFSILLGILMALGMLIQQRFIFFVAPPMIIIIVRVIFPGKQRKETRTRRKSLINILLCLFITAAFTLPYYFRYFTVFSTKFSYGVSGGAWEPVQSGFAIDSLAWYLGQIQKEVSLFFFILFIATALYLIFKPNRERVLIILTFLGGYFLISLYPSKDARYICPLLPLAALVTADGFNHIRRKPAGIVIGALIIFFAMGNYLRVNWNIGPFKIPYHKSLVKIPLLNLTMELVPAEHPPRPYSNWRWKEIAEKIRDDLKNKEGKLLVVPYLPEFNAETFNYFCLLGDVPVEAVDMGTQNLYHYNFRNLLDSDYILTKSGEAVPYSHIRFEFAEKTVEMLKNPPGPFLENHILLEVFSLPDGSEAFLFKRVNPVGAEEEITMIEESLKIDPAHPWAYLALGEAYLSKEDPVGALNNFEKVIRLLPDWPGGYLGAGRSKLLLGQKEEALQLALKGTALAPEFPFAHYVLGMVYEELGDIEEALKEYNIALTGKPVLVEKAQKRIQAIQKKYVEDR